MIKKKGKIYMLEKLGYGLRVLIVAGFIAILIILIWNLSIGFIEWSKKTYKRTKKNIKEKFNSYKKERKEHKKHKARVKSISQRVKQKKILTAWNEYLIDIYTEKMLEKCQDFSIEEIEIIYKYITQAVPIDLKDFPYDKKGSDKLIKEIEKLLSEHDRRVK